MNIVKFLKISFLAVFLSGAPLLAETINIKSEVINGMSYNEVLKVLGEPQEKVAYEIKREDIWHYKDGEVLFREGKVVSSTSSVEKEEEPQQIAVKPVLKERPEEDWGAIEDVKNDVEMKDIFSDIATTIKAAEEKEKLKKAVPPPRRGVRQPYHR